jgi:hypothetical protein
MSSVHKVNVEWCPSTGIINVPNKSWLGSAIILLKVFYFQRRAKQALRSITTPVIR